MAATKEIGYFNSIFIKSNTFANTGDVANERYYIEEDGISMRNFTGGTIAVSIPHFWKTTMRAAPTITGTNATANETISARGFQAYKGTIGSGASWQLTGTKATAEL